MYSVRYYLAGTETKMGKHVIGTQDPQGYVNT